MSRMAIAASKVWAMGEGMVSGPLALWSRHSPNFMTLFRFPPRLMVLQVGRSTSTGKSSEARSANGLKWSRVSSQARIKIPCPAQPDALTTIPRWQPLAGSPAHAGIDR